MAVVLEMNARAPALQTITTVMGAAALAVVGAPYVASAAVAAPSSAFATGAGRMAIFYTDGLASSAAQLASNIGGRTIQMTFGGRVLNGITGMSIFGQTFYQRFYNTSDKLWTWGSQHFAEGVTGRCIVVQQGACDPNKMWNKVERPILEFNRIVIQPIIASPPEVKFIDLCLLK